MACTVIWCCLAAAFPEGAWCNPALCFPLCVWDSSLKKFGHMSSIGAVIHSRRPDKDTEETRTVGHITAHFYCVL